MYLKYQPALYSGYTVHTEIHAISKLVIISRNFHKKTFILKSKLLYILLLYSKLTDSSY